MRTCWQDNFKALIFEPFLRLLEGASEVCLTHEKLSDDIVLSVTVADRTIIRRIAAPATMLAPTDVLMQELASLEALYRSFKITDNLTEVEREALVDGTFQANTIGIGFGSVRTSFNAFQQLICNSYNVEQFAKRSRVSSRQVVIYMRHSKVYFFRYANCVALPKFQIYCRKLLPGLTSVCPYIPKSAHPLAVTRWFLTSHPDLYNLSPRIWLIGRKPIMEVISLIREI